MTFNSTIFVVFFVVVYAAYLACGRRYKIQNIVLLIASNVFYGYWDWRFLGLLWFTAFLDFHISHAIARSTDERWRKRLLIVSITLNLGFLGILKYYNFFAGGLCDLLTLVGLRPSPLTLQIILPVGISFYTFQTMSYVIDVYRGVVRPQRDALSYSLFIAFFPQLVAGPIERAQDFLPQVSAPRRITLQQINDGLFLIIWGYYQKVVVADNMGVIANDVFNNEASHAGLGVLLGILAFSLQILGDFSGYSDIARGTAKLLGFELTPNFKLPYFAESPSDFWTRWHVTLSRWLRDYLYFPLGGNRRGPWITYRNLLVTMALGGLWHGAGSNFILWGVYHGILLIAYRVVEGSGGGRSRGFVWLRIPLMFFFTALGWVFFRATSLQEIGHLLGNVGFGGSVSADWIPLMIWTSLPLLLIQIAQQRSGDLLCMAKLPVAPRAAFYGFCLLMLSIFGARQSIEFIYFQF